MKTKVTSVNKPYNRCLSCHHRKVRCDGPRTSAMTLARWCEFMRDMKELNGLTNAEIAKRSGVSVKRVESLMALNSDQDIMRETARLIEDAIIGSSNQYPCYLAFEEAEPEEKQKLNDAMRELERALNDNKDYRHILDEIHESYKAEINTLRDDAQKKIDFLLAEIQSLRTERDSWRAENERKNKIIDTITNTYINKLIPQGE